VANELYFGDNLGVLRESVNDESIDLIYLDPPFNSQATYNVLFKAPTGARSHAQIEAFEDTWHWGESAEWAFDAAINSGHTDVSEVLRALRSFLHENDVMAYISMLAIRLLELHRTLKPTGSLYLHCDPTASHYLKILLDAIFGVDNFINEVSWRRSTRRSSIGKILRRAHDVLLFYAKSSDYHFFIQRELKSDKLLRKYSQHDEGGAYQFVPLMMSGRRNGETGMPWRGIDPNTRGKAGLHWVTKHNILDEYAEKGLVKFPTKPDGTPRLKYYLSQNEGIPISDFWDDIDIINSMGNESLGYPTQKPVALLERIITLCTVEGDLVLDPFCGCGTTIHAAQKLNRRWIGIDITHLAISLIEKRLNDAFPGIKYEVHGTPKDLEGARDLASRDKYQFQWWAISLINAVPFGGKKKGADTGIDGLIYFKHFEDGKAATEKIVVSVKGGENVNVTMIRDLAHVVDREKAKMGLFVTLAEPTSPMKVEAIKEGYYVASNGRYPKLQIASIEDLLAGKKPDLPPSDPTAFAKAPTESGKQGKLL
jgi:DNA modification methylase